MPGRGGAGGRGGLTTRGRCLLAAGFAAALCALLLDERDLLRVAAFVLALPPLAILVTSRARHKLQAARELVPPRTPVDSRCEVGLTVRSVRPLGGGLLLEDGVPAVLGGAPRFVVARLPGDGGARLRYTLRPMQRGVHSLGPLVARITDPFGVAEYRWELAGYSRLVVPPVVVPLTAAPSGGAGATREEGSGRQRRGPGADTVVVRSYRPGDDLRKVHWRSTARRGELMMRVEEQPRHGGTAVLLDHRVRAHRGSGPTASLEYAMSLAASVCRHLDGHGQRFRLVTIDGQLLADRTDTALDALAALSPAAPDAIGNPAALADGLGLVAVLGAVEPAGVEQLVRHRPRGLPGHAVILDVAAWDPAHADTAARVGTGDPAAAAPDPAETARLLSAAGWSATVARPEQPIGAVWDRLCRAPAAAGGY
jgi:uncharacterized protein (DUF58 family)